MHAYVGLVTVIQLHRMENNDFEKKEDNQTKGFKKKIKIVIYSYCHIIRKKIQHVVQKCYESSNYVTVHICK